MEKSVTNVLSLPGVVRRKLDMCCFNLRVTGPDGSEGLAKKPNYYLNQQQHHGETPGEEM